MAGSTSRGRWPAPSWGPSSQPRTASGSKGWRTSPPPVAPWSRVTTSASSIRSWWAWPWPGLGRKIHFLTVTEVSDHPVAAWTLRTLDQVSIRREAGDRRTFNRFAALARGGALTGVFPEGRIGDGRRLLAPQKGAARVALSADVPVIPAGLWGTQERWPNTGLRLTRPLRPTVALVFGRPIVASGDPRCPGDVRALRDRVMREIEALASRARRLSAPPDGR
ncbi:MAG TPA: lysophospholipid acyltransferase family protein, partial [Actinomycetota bacterium]